MKKIIGIIYPFDTHQNFYVYQDGNKLEITHAKIEDVPATIFNLAETYNVEEVDLSGAKHYIKGIIKTIQEEEITRYSKNKLTIKCI